MSCDNCTCNSIEVFVPHVRILVEGGKAIHVLRLVDTEYYLHDERWPADEVTSLPHTALKLSKDLNDEVIDTNEFVEAMHLLLAWYRQFTNSK